MILSLATALAIAAQPAPCDDWGKQGKLLYREDFSGSLRHWATEYKHAPGSRVAIEHGKLVMDVGSGATAWFRPKLSGDVLITFKRKVVMEGGKNDRLSDLNMFWMASDPHAPLRFDRSGKFSDYDGLRMYYAGVGGNTNTTTRFRKYQGTGERTLLDEANDPAHLLVPNHEYTVRIAVYHGCTRVWLDGQAYLTWRDPQPLTEGYFGLRTTQSRQEIDDLKIYKLD
jgi:hypothetical protein